MEDRVVATLNLETHHLDYGYDTERLSGWGGEAVATKLSHMQACSNQPLRTILSPFTRSYDQVV